MSVERREQRRRHREEIEVKLAKVATQVGEGVVDAMWRKICLITASPGMLRPPGIPWRKVLG